ncbi:hypothetical protein O0L34_g16063 [Tuta absoluta]|nr:hypothetical protein O0L34_g16063 [Tuta absoluta]
MVNNKLWFGVLLYMVTLAVSKSKFHTLSKDSVTALENDSYISQESNTHIALRLLSQLFHKRPPNKLRPAKKKKQHTTPEPFYDYDSYWRNEENEHTFCLGSKCFLYLADKGKFIEIRPNADVENFNVLSNVDAESVNAQTNYLKEDRKSSKEQLFKERYFVKDGGNKEQRFDKSSAKEGNQISIEDKNNMMGENIDDGYERDDEDETSDKNNSEIKNKGSAKYTYVDDLDITSNKLRNKDTARIPVSEDYVGDLFKYEKGKVFTKEYINEQRHFLSADRHDVNEKNINYGYEKNDDDQTSHKNNAVIDNKGSARYIYGNDLYKTSNPLRNKDAYAKSQFSEDYVGELLDILRATEKELKNNDKIGKKKDISEQRHQAEEFKDFESRKRGAKLSSVRRKQLTTTPRTVDNTNENDSDNIPADATDESKSNESASKKADDPKSNESGLKKTDDPKANESGIEESDDPKSNESGLKMTDVPKSNEIGLKAKADPKSKESGPKKKDDLKSNESEFKIPDESVASESQSKETETKWNRFKVVKQNKKTSKKKKSKSHKKDKKASSETKAVPKTDESEASAQSESSQSKEVETKWNRFKVVKHSPKVGQKKQPLSQENDRFQKASTETLESFSAEPAPKSMIKKKSKPRIVGKPEHYTQSHSRLVTEGEDFRRRLPHFMPKRYHWDEKDFQRLGYFWFNGPQGRIPPGPWKLAF